MLCTTAIDTSNTLCAYFVDYALVMVVIRTNLATTRPTTTSKSTDWQCLLAGRAVVQIVRTATTTPRSPATSTTRTAAAATASSRLSRVARTSSATETSTAATRTDSASTAASRANSRPAARRRP